MCKLNAIVVGYHGPLPQDPAIYSGKWTPEHLDAFWSEFLATHALERDDRTAHELSMVRFYDLNSLPSDLPTPPGYPRRMWRRRDDIDEDKSSSSTSSEVQRTSHRPPAKRTRVEGLRQSERIRNQQSRTKANTTAVGASIPLVKASARKRGRGSKTKTHPERRSRK